MKVQELIEKLKKINPDADVRFCNAYEYHEFGTSKDFGYIDIVKEKSTGRELRVNIFIR